MKALTKKRMPFFEEREETPTKLKRLASEEQGIEKPLIRDEEIDSLYNKSAEKNLFEVGAEGSSSAHSHLSGSKRGQPARGGAPDDPAYLGAGMDYDLNALFTAANDLMTSRHGQSHSQQRRRRPEVEEDEDVRQMKRMNEVSLLMDAYKQEVEDKFVSRLNRSELTFLKKSILAENSVNPGTLNPDSNPQNTEGKNKKGQRRLVFDESTFLPHSSSKIDGLGLSGVDIDKQIDWGKYHMDVKVDFPGADPEGDRQADHLEKDRSFIFNSIRLSTTKKRSPRSLRPFRPE